MQLHEGWLLVPANGTYQLFLNSDDGSALYLDGKVHHVGAAGVGGAVAAGGGGHAAGARLPPTAAQPTGPAPAHPAARLPPLYSRS